MTARLLPMGPEAVLVEGVDDPAAWALGLRALGLDGVVDVVPAAETVLVTGDVAAVRERWADVVPVSVDPGRELVVIPIRYDGVDLRDVAAAAGCSVDAVIAAHSGAEYTAAFCGFAPGFAYLTGLPEALHLPRRASPRTRVPAGSVAIAGRYTAVYPTASPGGWHLLGTTERTLFDSTADRPALIRPGDRVRFRQV